MPVAIYRFEFLSQLTTQAVLERVRSLTREPPSFLESFKESFGSRPEDRPPFIGRVEGSDFKIYRHITYRNSFLPRIHGHVGSEARGTKVNVTMRLHPLVMLFMIVWLGGVGAGAIAMINTGKAAQATIPAGMFVFGVALTLGGFYPEAIKARRLLETSLGKTNA